MKIDPKLIKKALIINGLLIVYFCCTNLSSFLGIVLGLGMFAIAQPCGFLSQRLKTYSQSGDSLLSTEYVHKHYNKFLKNTLGKQIFSLIALYILTKITWYIPTWLVLLVVGQAYVLWDVLKENQVFEKIEGYVKLAKQSIQKVTSLIPKYKSTQTK